MALAVWAGTLFLNFVWAAAEPKVEPSTETKVQEQPASENTLKDLGNLREPSSVNRPTPKATFKMNDISLSPRQAAGQLLMIGIVGTRLTAQMKQQLAAVQPGSVILFHRNVGSLAELRALTLGLQKVAKENGGAPFLVATDQEGGNVARIPLSAAMPSALAVGNTQDPELAFELGYRVGQTLRRSGVGLNLAPVFDSLPSQDRPSFIGERSFGRNPELISKMGMAFSLGLKQAGVAATAKHFPGTVANTSDPHLQAAVIPKVDNSTIGPFTEYLTKEAGALMLSHDSVSLTGERPMPATVSSGLVSGVLRETLHYDGVVITDDLTMGAISGLGTLPDIALKSLAAGTDIVMITWGPKDQVAAVDRIEKAILAGELKPDQVQGKLNRIAKLKRLEPVAIEAGKKIRSYEELVSLIVNANIRKGLSQIPARNWPDISKASGVRVYSSSPDLAKAFEKSLGRPVLWSAPGADAPLAESINQIESATAFAVVEVDSAKMQRELERLPATLKKKLLLVNESSPGRLQRSGYFGVVELNYKTGLWGPVLASQINNFWQSKLKTKMATTPSQPED